MTGSWKTTVIGLLAGIVTYFSQLGPNLPTTAAEWGTAFVAALLASLGLGAKDSNVSNAPNPSAAKPVN